MASSATQFIRPRSIADHKPRRVARVLVVEDDRDLQPIYERAIGDAAGHLEVDFVHSAEAALEHLRMFDYQLVILDYLLDGPRSGLSVIDWCTTHRSDLNIALISGLPLNDAMARVPWSLPILRKPFTYQELRSFLAGLTVTEGAIVAVDSDSRS